MTKEQLEELIEQKGTVYDIDGLEIELYSKAKCHIVPKFDGMHDYLVVRYINSTKYFYIGQLMDKEHYEWRQKVVAERTEQFDPPMWEDIEEHYTFDWLNKGHHYRLAVDRPHQCIVITDFTIKEDIFDELALKENYEKACGIVRRLFSEEVK